MLGLDRCLPLLYFSSHLLEFTMKSQETSFYLLCSWFHEIKYFATEGPNKTMNFLKRQNKRMGWYCWTLNWEAIEYPGEDVCHKAWVQIPALPPANCVTLNKLLNLSGPQFSCQQNVYFYGIGDGWIKNVGKMLKYNRNLACSSSTIIITPENIEYTLSLQSFCLTFFLPFSHLLWRLAVIWNCNLNWDHTW